MPSGQHVTLPILLIMLAASAAHADDYTLAESKKPTAIAFCHGGQGTVLPKDCDALISLAGEIDGALRPALAKVGPLAAPLLKRDQVWFRDMIEALSETALSEDFAPDGRDQVEAALQERRKMLDDVAASAGRAGITGRWSNAFGTIEITEAGGGAVHVSVETSSAYEIGEEGRQSCRASARLTAGPAGWSVGPMEAEAAAETAAESTTSADSKAAATPILKLARQGETLRVVAGIESAADNDASSVGCNGVNQITGTYFAVNGADAANASAAHERPLVTPTFDCAKPATADEEEICSDPELAENDRRLNAAWTKLLPRLDAETKRFLKDDQRAYVASQAAQYPQFLHPAWEKQSYNIHHTGYGRDMLAKLQRERIAVLEGFDEKRRGFEGLWMAANAQLAVRADGGKLAATGWKWFQGDWKAGCEYSIEGAAQGSAFRPSQEGPNPDTLERDHATLVVNRADDRLAPRRSPDDGAPDPAAGEQKCRRNVTISSTARLFPVRPSPDLDISSDTIR
jgi:uncharacterized protein YecT (DUF1311 family)